MGINVDAAEFVVLVLRFRLEGQLIMATVAVPNLIGLGRTDAESALNAALLRYFARFPFGASADGRASTQSPAPGTVVPQYCVVTVDYPSPLGPMGDRPVDGPMPSGPLEGTVTGVTVREQGAWVEFTIEDGLSFEFQLYLEASATPVPREV